jgi:hypothetical protein
MIAILGFSFPIIGHSKNVQSQNPKTNLFVSSDIPLARHLPIWDGKRKERIGQDRVLVMINLLMNSYGGVVHVVGDALKQWK